MDTSKNCTDEGDHNSLAEVGHNLKYIFGVIIQLLYIALCEPLYSCFKPYVPIPWQLNIVIDLCSLRDMANEGVYIWHNVGGLIPITLGFKL